MTLEIQAPPWDGHKNVAGLNESMGSQPSPLGNWISNGTTYTYIYIQTIKKTCTETLPLKKNHILSQK